MDPGIEPPRTPEEIRRTGNHLTSETSVYLRQHAHNPLDWYPWGEEALARARREDKPIFLSIGYSSCHWCHVMEEEVFSKDDVAEFMNANFICIKVDREERPDLDSVYMEAVQAMTRSGGWPMSVFLTPDLKPFFGGAYFPHGPFMELTRQIHQLFTTRRDDLEAQAGKLSGLLSRGPRVSGGGAVRDPVLTAAAELALRSADERWGGFRAGQKFPTPLRWRFLLHRYRKTGDHRYGRIVRTTLDQMGSGGIHDQIGGGFHRYTIEESWLIPHFEKMLYDNAQIAGLYTEAAVVFADARFGEIARQTLDFILREMTDENGGFYGSFDADSGGEEGTFYIWSPQEIEAVAGAEDGPALAMLLGVTEAGNFEGKSIPTRRVPAAAVAERFGRPESEIAGLIDRWRPVLRERRAGRVRPGLDVKIVTSWNGLAISAFAQGYAAFGDPQYRAAAENAADFLWAHHRGTDGRLLRASTHGATGGEAVLDDYAFLADGLLELYLAAGRHELLVRSLALLETALELFAHPEAGFFLTPEALEAPLGRQVEFFDSVRPSGNSMMLRTLLRTSALTGNTGYWERVEKALAGHADLIERSQMEMAGWLDVAQSYLGPFYEVIIAGDPAAAETAEMVSAFRKLLPPHAVLVTVPGSGASEEIAALLAPAAGKTAVNGKATAYVCRLGACRLPTSDPDDMRAQLLEGWAH